MRNRDAYVDDDDVADGQTVRVRMDMMDGLQRAVSCANLSGHACCELEL